MNKSIVVIKTPKNCRVCPFRESPWSFCLGEYEKEKHCPLKPMPQRKIVGEIEKVDDFMKSDIQIINEKVTATMMLDTELLLASGYNLCIDEILGE